MLSTRLGSRPTSRKPNTARLSNFCRRTSVVGQRNFALEIVLAFGSRRPLLRRGRRSGRLLRRRMERSSGASRPLAHAPLPAACAQMRPRAACTTEAFTTVVIFIFVSFVLRIFEFVIFHLVPHDARSFVRKAKMFNATRGPLLIKEGKAIMDCKCSTYTDWSAPLEFPQRPL